MEKYISVLNYPQNEVELNNVIKIINDFVFSLNKQYKIILPFIARSTASLSPAIQKILFDLLNYFENTYNSINIDYILDLFEIIKNPSQKMLNIIKPSYTNQKKLWKHFLNAKRIARSLDVNEVFQFISLKKIKLKIGQGPYGATKGTYPFTVAINTTIYREVIYHELLHQLGVDDGYSKKNEIITHTCSVKCFMQYDPTLGNMLCDKHVNELIKFSNNNRLS